MCENGIKVMWVHLNADIPDKTFAQTLQTLPVDWHSDIVKYFQHEDRNRSLAGKILLVKLLHSLAAVIPGSITYTNKKKPIIPALPGVDFSISHSGSIVVCALATSGLIGVDIEIHRTLDFLSVKSTMTEDQWHNIHLSARPHETFFDFWTLKECIAKASGLGLYLPFHDMDISKNPVISENDHWTHKKIKLNPDYCCHLAHNRIPTTSIEIQEIDHFNVFLPF